MLDNIGILLAGLFRPISSGAKSVPNSKSTDGVVANLKVYDVNAVGDHFNKMNNADTTQVGKGTTPATRQDFNIEVPFTNGGLEDNPFPTNTVGYDSLQGKISIPAIVSPTTGSGAITEVCHYVSWKQSPSASIKQMLLLHDIIQAVNFINGESLHIEHEVLI